MTVQGLDLLLLIIVFAGAPASWFAGQGLAWLFWE